MTLLHWKRAIQSTGIHYMIKKTKKSKEEKLYDNLLKVTQQFMSGKSFLPLSFDELMEKLCLPPQHELLLKEILDELVEEGTLNLEKGRYSVVSRKKVEIVTGIIKMHPRGFGFVQVEAPTTVVGDVFIPKPFTMNAVDGDKVEIVINTDSVSEKGPEGRVVTIIERGRTHIAGIIRFAGFDEHLAYVPMLGPAQRVVVQVNTEIPLIIGDRIVMKVIDWGSKETQTLCEVSHKIGHISDPSCDIPAAIEEFGLRAEFPTAAVEEAEAYGKIVKASEIKAREDLREMESFTIDPDTAKDFDDAISICKEKNGNFRLAVHIADVSHYVKEGTALDKEARARANSTYFPAYCLPMLPRQLSDNLCSLKPNVNRLTLSVLMSLDSQGNLLNYRIARTVIKSCKRFTYREAKKVLDGEAKSPYADSLHLMVELCQLLKAKRNARGSVDLSTPELVVMVGADGVPTGTDYIEYDITHQMVEEFMLKANEVVATHLTDHGKNLPYRVHDEPAAESLKDFATLVHAFGFELPIAPTQEDLQQFFIEAMKTEYGQHLATSYIRRMRMAIYSPENIGHYGLSLSHYCHFTSPIRRYADLIVHRILFGDSDDRAMLDEITAHCSAQERISAKAEGNVVTLKKLRLIDALYKEDPTKKYKAVVTGVKPFGITIDILDFMMESFIHVSEIGDDYFEYEERRMLLRGQRTGMVFSAGVELEAILINVDFILLESKWELVPAFSEEDERPEKKKVQKRRKEKEKHAKSKREPKRERSPNKKKKKKK